MVASPRLPAYSISRAQMNRRPNEYLRRRRRRRCSPRSTWFVRVPIRRWREIFCPICLVTEWTAAGRARQSKVFFLTFFLSFFLSSLLRPFSFHFCCFQLWLQQNNQPYDPIESNHIHLFFLTYFLTFPFFFLFSLFFRDSGWTIREPIK